MSKREKKAKGGLVLGKQQKQAMRRIEKWYERDERQVFKLFGFAGTGKTTIARLIPDRIGVAHDKVLYAAYTGKAAHVLRSKGCEDAGTLHSLIYKPVDALEAEITELLQELAQCSDKPERRITLMREMRELREAKGRPGFILQEDSPLAEAELLVIDEVSMVNRVMAEDILSFGVPVLVLGDPAQLPPVGGEGYFTKGDPDYVLTDVHRQAKGSEVLDLATQIRSGGTTSQTARLSPTNSEAKGFDQIIVGTNRTRWRFIRKMRRLHGLEDPYPMQGDKVICLANNRDHDVFNGQMFRVVAATRRGDVVSLTVQEDEPGGKVRTVSAWADGFLGADQEASLKTVAHMQRDHALMTYGWAITCHKAQGSQWDRVLIVDESSVFRQHRTRWLYTAVTRASKEVALMGRATSKGKAA